MIRSEADWLSTWQLCGELLSLREGDAPGTTSEEDVERRRRHNRPVFPQGAVQVQHTPAPIPTIPNAGV